MSRCSGITLQKEQCKRGCPNKFCWQHKNQQINTYLSQEETKEEDKINQCYGITRRHTRCRKYPKKNKSFCHHHIDQNIKINKKLLPKLAEIEKDCKNIIKPKKQRIPHALKIACWNKNIGEKIGQSKCFCCKITKIEQLNFHAGHIISEANGGILHIDNILPICKNCNLSMNTQNLYTFKNKYFK
jgi:hypothetical protein